MACARVPLDERQVTEPGPLGKERTLPALVSHLSWCQYANISIPSQQQSVLPQKQHLTKSGLWESNPMLSVPHQHPDRKEERCFVPYKPPPEDGSPAEVEEFLELTRFITEDLEWLLAQPHDKFWCQVKDWSRVGILLSRIFFSCNLATTLYWSQPDVCVGVPGGKRDLSFNKHSWCDYGRGLCNHSNTFDSMFQKSRNKRQIPH